MRFSLWGYLLGCPSLGFPKYLQNAACRERPGAAISVTSQALAAISPVVLSMLRSDYHVEGVVTCGALEPLFNMPVIDCPVKAHKRGFGSFEALLPNVTLQDEFCPCSLTLERFLLALGRPEF